MAALDYAYAGGSVRIRVFGNPGGIPLALIHGNHLSAEFFAPLMSGAASRLYRCAAVDLPGHGDSRGFAASSYAVAGIVDLLEATLAHLFPRRRAVILGHSLGVHLATHLVARGYEPAGLMLLSAYPLESVADFGAAYQPIPELQHLFTETLTPAAQIALARAYSATDPQRLDQCLALIGAVDPAFRRGMSRVFTDPGYPDEISALQRLRTGARSVPLIFAVGDRDQFVNQLYPQEKRLAERLQLAASAVRTIPKCDHFPLWEAPGWVDNALSELARDVV